jgi:hypothetical protein
MNGVDRPRGESRIVAGVIARTNWMRQPLGLEDALYRRTSGRVNTQVFQLALNGARTNQPVARLGSCRRFQLLPNRPNGVRDRLGNFGR